MITHHTTPYAIRVLTAIKSSSLSCRVQGGRPACCHSQTRHFISLHPHQPSTHPPVPLSHSKQANLTLLFLQLMGVHGSKWETPQTFIRHGDNLLFHLLSLLALSWEPFMQSGSIRVNQDQPGSTQGPSGLSDVRSGGACVAIAERPWLAQ